ncbi:peptide-N(4)-(N-acetyl-beta-glucosaminyl)asparagine amidase [Patella vulgata]|uniref:peptide-N(4)-(N-acetyl-beta- glucosaminyl)asparagine amidase n=1 Tax=Patella vulgata TaxID=6465 RepID=UPI00218077B6|nr:peptide-N(4)-(N-acetyl-beta-glucosaminyl)asparagine amidase [Patella vulgata]
MTWDSVLQLATENESKTAFEAIDILLKFCKNIIKNPSEEKYRRIRLKNPIIESKLLPVSGAMECLFDMGFLEDGEFLTMPLNCSLSVLTVIRNELTEVKDALRESDNLETVPLVPLVSAPNTPQTASTIPQAAPTRPAPPTNIIMSEAKFYSKLDNSLQHVLMYENSSLQDKARSVIPIETLQKEATQKLETILSADRSQQIDIQDCLLLCLLDWFKTSFFSWVDSLACERCTGPTTNNGMLPPNSDDERWQAGRVESHRCNVCASITRFPRYNHPGKLLETRRGRCGEWANCFTLCCRALGFEARYVLDWTDHVWTEVYSQSQQRWLHCDPCENVCDKPLSYEAGWGKALTYVIAFSKDEIMDVTWRYSAKHAEVRSRRNECREDWLVSTIYKINKNKRSAMAPARQKVMLNRTIVELVEFLTVKTADNLELSGRTTGSLAWRLARGETGGGMSNEPFIFTLSEREKQLKKVHVKYNCPKNHYVRISNNNEEKKDWSSLCFQSTSLARKEEKEWKMVYIARAEGSENASVSWKFDFSESTLKIDKVIIKAESCVYENGVITWKICGDDQCIMLNGKDLNLPTPVDVKGSSSLTITGSLTKGIGNVAWQHTQLFRQSSTDFNNFPFEIEIYLM